MIDFYRNMWWIVPLSIVLGLLLMGLCTVFDQYVLNLLWPLAPEDMGPRVVAEMLLAVYGPIFIAFKLEARRQKRESKEKSEKNEE